MSSFPPSPPSSQKIPQTFGDLFGFYHTYVKALYSDVQSEDTLPLETLFELNAALDHISRHHVYGEAEAVSVGKSYGHLKRSCFDICKIAVREARKQYDALRRIDTSAIDNGDFDRNLIQLFSRIRKGSRDARLNDSRPPSLEDIDAAFDAWQPVLADCMRLQTEFYENQHINWAKRRNIKRFIAAAVIGAATAAVIGQLLQKFI
ncbi:MAG: hypothetical protein LBP86_03950 [Azoarcus sp.]|jgi:hypothetical protein|nr:hypothetical protein [Azoarcus sp.]